ncbi:RluA family pseudouridine synthase [Pseudomonas sp. BN102]|uniref:RluA family pseudouridine synthase n=1 Tax=Pseudomonas sp. BN102 TaxID=2567886 RepID=UPI002456BCF8|nr:RluA family pseudouridine synthase [Pseudomonas sp. BN102]MDH4612622.1 pseudouridine synthase [Pseudomonas sp. BN102]
MPRPCNLPKQSMPSTPNIRPSTLHLPQGDWATLLDCLCAHFPAISRDTWLERMARGRVLDAEGRPLGPDHPYRIGLRVHYFREVKDEKPIPFEESVLHVDDHLVVADKPHFLPVMPAGEYVEETLQARLTRRLGNPDLVPLHRIDRHTAGLVLFSANPASRGRYQALFRERQMHKHYEAIAPALPGVDFPLLRETRLDAGEPFFRMQEVEGVANSRTRLEVIEKNSGLWRYALYPITGKKHQLRVHLAALGAPICNDGFYPLLTDQGEPDDYQRPLKLLARGLAFDDPLSGESRCFESRLRLDW